MTNLSKIKREKMLNYIANLLENCDNEMDRIALNDIATVLNEKKYGLVWEEYEENVDVMLEENIPILIEEENRKIKKVEENSYNFLIEGDNLHSLTLLKKITFNKKVVIYIDIPYNTKNKDFVYDDKKIDYNDSYKHSKWISFIEKRLRLARDILKDDELIFISIDENEQAQLKLLCDSIYGECNFLTTFIRKTKSMTGDQKNVLNVQHEYLLAYAKNKNKIMFKGRPKNMKNYKNPDNDPNGRWCSGDPSAKSGGETTYFPIENPYTGQIDYPPEGRYWAFSKSTMENYIKTGRIKFKKKIVKNQRGFTFKRYWNNLQSKYNPVGTLDFIENKYMNSVATTEQKEIYGASVFNYPKPVDFIIDILNTCSEEDSIILDFFAGSGTTGHAVVQMNKEDGGSRRYILCTNNENNLCENVTYKRLINIQKELPHNLKYFKTGFIPKEEEQSGYNIDGVLEDYVKPLIELQYHCDIDDKNIMLAFEYDEVDAKIDNANENAKLFKPSTLFLSVDTEKKVKEKNIEVIDIPKYYYSEEILKIESGEKKEYIYERRTTMAKVKELKLELQLVQAQLLKALKDKLESNPNLNIIEVKALCREFYDMQDNFVNQFENIVAEFEETLSKPVDKEI